MLPQTINHVIMLYFCQTQALGSSVANYYSCSTNRMTKKHFFKFTNIMRCYTNSVTSLFWFDHTHRQTTKWLCVILFSYAYPLIHPFVWGKTALHEVSRQNVLTSATSPASFGGLQCPIARGTYSPSSMSWVYHRIYSHPAVTGTAKLQRKTQG